MIVLFRPVLFRTQKKFKGSKPEFVASYGDGTFDSLIDVGGGHMSRCGTAKILHRPNKIP